MSKFIKYEPCPRCRESGRDNAGDNCAIYDDGSKHCFACSYHINPKRYVKHESVRTEVKKGIPNDFSTTIPAKAWKWLLQYGLGYKYWQEYCGYSETEERLIFKVGSPAEFYIGRYFGKEDRRKWYVWGNSHNTAHIFGDVEKSESIVLVEDLISAHKLGQVVAAIPLFGTNIFGFKSVLSALRLYRKPVVMWLDEDQRQHAVKRAARLAAITGCKVSFIFTKKDPKCLNFSELREQLSLG